MGLALRSPLSLSAIMNPVFNRDSLPHMVPLVNAAQRSSSPARYEHPEFYIDDETVIFLVEDCYFKVHTYFLQRDSEVFRTMFACPPGDAEPEGRTKETAIVLPGVTKFEMASLLRFFYHGMYESYTSWSLKITTAEWAALLSISTRFAFEHIRARAIAVLSPPHASHYPHDGAFGLLDPIDAAVLAAAHDVPQWLPPAYAALTARAAPLDEREGVRLGVGTALRIAAARERFLREVLVAGGMGEGRLEEDVRLGAGASYRRASSVGGDGGYAAMHLRAARIVQEVFWPQADDATAAGA